MKINFVLLSIALAYSSITNAENFDLFVQDGTADFKPIANVSGLLSKSERLIAQGTYNNKIGKTVSNKSVIDFNLFGELESFNVTNVIRKQSNKVSYAASSSAMNTLSVSQNNGRIVGSLWRDGTLYKLRPATDGSTLLIEVPNETLIDHDKNYQENIESQGAVDAKDLKPSASSQSDSAAEYTVIVAYTSAFASTAVDITAYMDLLELETNTAYVNSGVTTSVKIVHAYQTDYVDSGYFDTDLDYFADTGNAEAAKLRALRKQYSADIMILLTGNGYGACGYASGIGVNADKAFAVTSEQCAVGYYSFGHEIGHLFGARHIRDTDPTATPFSYGHGYCNVTADTWRTIMAYGCQTNPGGNRIQQWSNPNVSILGSEGEQPTGTVLFENNARVLNERALAVANFETDDFLLMLLPAIISGSK